MAAAFIGIAFSGNLMAADNSPILEYFPSLEGGLKPENPSHLKGYFPSLERKRMIRQRDSEMAQHKRILDWEKQTSLPGISALHGEEEKK